MSLRERLATTTPERQSGAVLPDTSNQAYQELKKSMHQLSLIHI